MPVASPTSAGPSERAGFIDAPEIGPPIMASKATTPPMATPARSPTSLAPTATPRITNIKRDVRTASSPRLWSAVPAGTVCPSVATPGKRSATTTLATSAPATCAATYGQTRAPGNRPEAQKATVTAGLMWAPETSPTA